MHPCNPTQTKGFIANLFWGLKMAQILKVLHRRKTDLSGKGGHQKQIRISGKHF